MFASAYGGSDTTSQTSASLIIKLEDTPSPKQISDMNPSVTHKRFYSLYDWTLITKAMNNMNSAEKTTRLNIIINSFSLALDHLVNQCQPDPLDSRIGIHQLVEVIAQMEEFAGSMCDAPQELRWKIFESPAMGSLRECMDAACTALAKYELGEFAAGLGLGARQVLAGQLWVVDAILMEVYAGETSDWESGIAKVIRLMENY